MPTLAELETQLQQDKKTAPGSSPTRTVGDYEAEIAEEARKTFGGDKGLLGRTAGAAWAGLERSGVGRPVAKFISKIPSPLPGGAARQAAFQREVALAPFQRPQGAIESAGGFAGSMFGDLPLFEVGGAAGEFAKGIGTGAKAARALSAVGAGAAQGAGKVLGQQLIGETPDEGVGRAAVKGAITFAPTALVPAARSVAQIARNVLSESAIFGASSELVDSVDKGKPVNFKRMAAESGGNVLPFALMALLHAKGTLAQEKVRQQVVGEIHRTAAYHPESEHGKQVANLDIDSLIDLLRKQTVKQDAIWAESRDKALSDVAAEKGQKTVGDIEAELAGQIPGIRSPENDPRTVAENAGLQPADFAPPADTGPVVQAQLPGVDKLAEAAQAAAPTISKPTTPPGPAAGGTPPGVVSPPVAPPLGPVPSIPEVKGDFDAQLALTAKGSKHATFIPDSHLATGARLDIPGALETHRVEPAAGQEGGVLMFNPKRVSAEDVQSAIANGKLGELLGYSQPAKPAGPEIGKLVVYATDKDGNEVHGELVDNTPEAIAKATQAAQAAAPGSKIEVLPQPEVVRRRQAKLTPPAPIPAEIVPPAPPAASKRPQGEAVAQEQALWDQARRGGYKGTLEDFRQTWQTAPFEGPERAALDGFISAGKGKTISPVQTSSTATVVPTGPFTVSWGTRSGGNKTEQFDDLDEAQQFQKRKEKSSDFVTIYDKDDNEISPAQTSGQSQPQVLGKAPAGGGVTAGTTPAIAGTSTPTISKEPWQQTRKEFDAFHFDEKQHRGLDVDYFKDHEFSATRKGTEFLKTIQGGIELRKDQHGDVFAFDGKENVGYGDGKAFIVKPSHQRQGIGTELMLATYNPSKPIGSSTSAGRSLIDSFHKRSVLDALAAGKPVPPTVLAEYLDLQKPAVAAAPVKPAETATTGEARTKATAAGIHPKSLERLDAAVAAKDGNALVQLLTLPNKHLRAIFAEEQGVSLSSTEGGTRKAVREWAGQTDAPAPEKPAVTRLETNPAPSANLPKVEPAAVTPEPPSPTVTNPATVEEAFERGHSVIPPTGKNEKGEVKTANAALLTLEGGGFFKGMVGKKFTFNNIDSFSAAGRKIKKITPLFVTVKPKGEAPQWGKAETIKGEFTIPKNAATEVKGKITVPEQSTGTSGGKVKVQQDNVAAAPVVTTDTPGIVKGESRDNYFRRVEANKKLIHERTWDEQKAIYAAESVSNRGRQPSPSEWGDLRKEYDAELQKVETKRWTEERRQKQDATEAGLKGIEIEDDPEDVAEPGFTWNGKPEQFSALEEAGYIKPSAYAGELSTITKAGMDALRKEGLLPIPAPASEVRAPKGPAITKETAALQHQLNVREFNLRQQFGNEAVDTLYAEASDLTNEQVLDLTQRIDEGQPIGEKDNAPEPLNLKAGSEAISDGVERYRRQLEEIDSQYEGRKDIFEATDEKAGKADETVASWIRDNQPDGVSSVLAVAGIDPKDPILGTVKTESSDVADVYRVQQEDAARIHKVLVTVETGTNKNGRSQTWLQEVPDTRAIKWVSDEAKAIGEGRYKDVKAKVEAKTEEPASEFESPMSSRDRYDRALKGLTEASKDAEITTAAEAGKSAGEAQNIVERDISDHTGRRGMLLAREVFVAEPFDTEKAVTELERKGISYDAKGTKIAVLPAFKRGGFYVQRTEENGKQIQSGTQHPDIPSAQKEAIALLRGEGYTPPVPKTVNVDAAKTELAAARKRTEGLKVAAEAHKKAAEMWATTNDLLVQKRAHRGWGPSKGDVKKSAPAAKVKEYYALEKKAREALSALENHIQEVERPAEKALERSNLAKVMNDPAAPEVSRLMAQVELQEWADGTTGLQEKAVEAAKPMVKEVYPDANDSEVTGLARVVINRAAHAAKDGKGFDAAVLKHEEQYDPQLKLTPFRRERILSALTTAGMSTEQKYGIGASGGMGHVINTTKEPWTRFLPESFTDHAKRLLNAPTISSEEVEHFTKQIPDTVKEATAAKDKDMAEALEASKKATVEKASEDAKPVERAPTGKTFNPVAVGKKPAAPDAMLTQVMPKRSTLPVLSTISVQGGRARATDLDVEVEVPMNLPDGLYTKAGKTWVLSGIKPDEFPPARKLEAQPGKDGKPAAGAKQHDVSLDSKQAASFRSALAHVEAAQSTDDTRYVLNGVLVKVENGQMTLVGTDGRRLHTATVGGDVKSPNLEMILPTDAVTALRKNNGQGGLKISVMGESDVAGSKYTKPIAEAKASLATAEEELKQAKEKEVRAVHTENIATIKKEIARLEQANEAARGRKEITPGINAFITDGDTTIRTKLIDGTYPNYKQVIPDPGKVKLRVEVDRKALGQALNDVEPFLTADPEFSGKGTPMVKVVLTPKGVKVIASVGAKRYHRESTVPVSKALVSQSKEVTAAFNIDYLRDQLQSSDSPTVVLGVEDELSPIAVQDSDGKGLSYRSGVLMPMRLSARGEAGSADMPMRTPIAREAFHGVLADETRVVPFAAENVTAGLSTDADAAMWDAGEGRTHTSSTGEARAMTIGNRSHFFLDRYDNASQLRDDIREEAGHRLVNEMGGRDWNIIGSLTYGGKWNGIAAEIERNYGFKRGSAEFNHELVAKAFRDGEHQSGVMRRFMDATVLAFKRLGRKLGFNLDMSDAEVRNYLRGMLDAKARGAERTGSVGGQARFAKSDRYGTEEMPWDMTGAGRPPKPPKAPPAEPGGEPERETGIPAVEDGPIDKPVVATTRSQLEDLIQTHTPGLEAGREIKKGIQSLLLPSAQSPEHLREAERLGRYLGESNRRQEASAAILRGEGRRFNRLGIDNPNVDPRDNPGIKFMGDMSRGREVETRFKPAAAAVKREFDRRIEALEKVDAAPQTLRENYFPGMWTSESRLAFNAAMSTALEEGIIPKEFDVNTSTADQRAAVKALVDEYMDQGKGSNKDALSYLTRRPMAGKESFKKQKVFDDILTAAEFGLRPISNNPIELVKLKLAEMDKSIMAHSYFKDLQKAGKLKVIDPYSQVPDGWVKVNDKYGTLYGPPTVTVPEFLDESIYSGLTKFMEENKIPYERKIGIGGTRLGYFQPAGDHIVARANTPLSVIYHELGHWIGEHYHTFDLFTQKMEGKYPTKAKAMIERELRAVADLHGYKEQYFRKAEEKEASLLEAFLTVPDDFQRVAPNLYREWEQFIGQHPELHPLTELKPSMKAKKIEHEKYVGLPIMGYRIVPTETGDIINNYLSSSLYNNKYVGTLYKGWMSSANALNQSQLGMGSAFHAGFTTGEVQVSAGANLIKDVYGVLRGNRSASDLAQTAKKWATATGRTMVTGDKILNAWRNPDGVIDPKIAQVVRATELAGGGYRMEKGLQTEQYERMVSDWFSGNKVKAAARSPIALTELMAKPIMDMLVPRQKAGVFADLAWRIIEQNPGKSLEELAPQFRQAWNRTDARLGQVRYERMFTNNTAKNVVQGLVRAPGWSGGTIAEIGGAFPDAAKFLKEWATTGKLPADIPDRTAYLLSLLVTAGAINGALTYAFTGQKPTGLDYLAFRDGKTDDKGNATRLLIPTYMKDLLAYAKQPGTTLVNKAHPLIAMLNEVLVKNADFYGVEIRHPDDNLIRQGAQTAKYVIKQFEPFWMRGAQKVRQQGGGLGEQVAPYIGVMPAPQYMTMTPTQKEATRLSQAQMPRGSRTQAEYDKSQFKGEIARAMKSGDTKQANQLIQQGIKSGQITGKGVQRLERGLGKPYLERQLGRVPVEEVVTLYERSSTSNEERAQLYPVLMRRIQRSDLPPQKRRELLNRVGKFKPTAPAVQTPYRNLAEAYSH